ncbi:hypothetical protein N8819_01825 [Gammaproteobacteria bacterium]|nr:hypothetical protein [Gammaproteobacteria bacterium]
MSGLWVVSILLVIVILLLISIIFLSLKEDPSKLSNEESLKDIDKAMERQEINISDLTKDIQSFHDPLDKLKRYLSGGTLAGKFGEWSLEAIVQDIFPPSQFEKKACNKRCDRYKRKICSNWYNNRSGCYVYT